METLVHTAPRPRMNRALKILGIIAAVFALGICALLLLLFLAVRSGSAANQTAAPVASRFMTLIEQHQFAAARQMMTPAAQAAVPGTKLQDLQLFVEKEHGRALSHSKPINWRVGFDNGVNTYRLGYNERFSGDVLPVFVTLARSGQSWGVLSITYPRI